jgi:hypothetical protein
MVLFLFRDRFVGSGFPDSISRASVALSNPPVLVPHDIGQMFLARVIENQADDECPHDRTPVAGLGPLSAGLVSRRLRVSGKMASSTRQIGFVGAAYMILPRPARRQLICRYGADTGRRRDQIWTAS